MPHRARTCGTQDDHGALLPDNFNRRSSPRAVLDIPVQYRFGDSIAAVLTLNRDRGGIAIRTASQLDKGSSVTVRFRTPGSKTSSPSPASRRGEGHGHGEVENAVASPQREGSSILEPGC
ncbi:MAG: hypothetical protein GEU82_06835 [Luteitalea sp.]|nr:hypothetical protein [Luteitalea sp.]